MESSAREAVTEMRALLGTLRASEAAAVSKDLFGQMRAMLDELAQAIIGRQERLRENALLPHAAAHSAMLQQLRSKLDFIRIDDALLKGKVAETKDVRTLALAGTGLAGLGVIITALSPRPSPSGRPASSLPDPA